VSSLDRKLLRDLWRLRLQALAIALVIASGVALMVMALTTTESLEATTKAYYERARFADVFARLKRAPDSLEARIAAIPGVRVAETRIVESGLLDVAGYREPVVATLVSLPKSGPQRLNALVLRTGRLPAPGRLREAVVGEPFAEAHHLRPGDTIGAVLRGRHVVLRIVGTALSPEFVYAIPPGGLMPDDRRFGVIWMGRDELAAAFGLKGAFDDVSLALSPGQRPQPVIARLDALLGRYGGTGAYDRAEQVSNWFLSNEIAQQKNMSRLMPAIFLGVAAFLTNMVMARLVATERREIGLLKAFGYGGGAIGWHYAKLVLAIAAGGIVLGAVLGAALGNWNTRLYREFFRFPFLLYQPGPRSFAIAAAVSLATSLAGGMGAVRRAVRLPPAIAMQPAPPAVYRRSRLGPAALGRFLDGPSRMIVRRLLRWPLRAFLASAGLALSVGVLILALQWADAVNALVETHYERGQRQDATITFTDLRPRGVLADIRHLPGVLAAEPFRIVPARLARGRAEQREPVTGVPADARLAPVHDVAQGTIDMPADGLVLSRQLAGLLHAGIGDPVRVQLLEGRRAVLTVPVVRLFDTYIGKPAYMNLAALNRRMGDGSVLSGVHVTLDEPRRAAFLARLRTLPGIAAIQFRRAAIDTFHRTMGETIDIFLGFFIGFASALSVGVIVNAIRIALSERERELATLRVLGFSRAEVAYILLGEIGLLVWIAIPLGGGAGTLLAWYFGKAFETELFRVPPVIYPSTYGSAALIMIATAGIVAAWLRRHLDRLDMIAVLKTRE
jgi:putative ABC transport system permease protein